MAEWISAKDRLPENSVRVLSVQEDGVVRINIVAHGTFKEITTREHLFMKTTHWMPLPEPPKLT